MSDGSEGPAGATTKPWSGGGREGLAAAVRRLMTAVVASSAPPELITEAAEQTSQLAADLARYVPVPGALPTARFADYPVEQGKATTMASAMPFDMIVGSCNPVAPPMIIEFDPPKALGRIDFTPQYEGAPGCVHGAALAGAFDIILTAANFLANAAGPTVELTIRYRKPTLISQPAVFEAWVTGRQGRRVHSRGQLIQDGIVTVEAVGEFVDMERSRIESLHRRKGGQPPDAAPDGTV
jgi:acyl-coenzyme A thioesterase PaaI-like protein